MLDGLFLVDAPHFRAPVGDVEGAMTMRVSIPSGKLCLLLIRDGVYFVVTLGFFFLPEPYGVGLLLVALLIIIPALGRAIRSRADEVGQSDRQIQLAVSGAYVCIYILLLIRWASRQANSRAWLIAGSAAMALVVYFIVSAASLYGRGRLWQGGSTTKQLWLFVSAAFAIAMIEWMAFSRLHWHTWFSVVANLIPAILFAGILYVSVVRRRNRQPGVPWFGIVIMVLALIFMLISMWLKR